MTFSILIIIAAVIACVVYTRHRSRGRALQQEFERLQSIKKFQDAAVLESERQGMDSWQKSAYPLKQLTITVNDKNDVGFLVQCLREQADNFKMSQLPDAEVDGEWPVTMPNSCQGEQHTVMTFNVCHEPPGFFPDAAGVKVPGHLESLTEDETPLTVWVQGTRHTTPDTFAWYIETVANRIEAGEVSGARFDDDSGYAFKVSTGHQNLS